MGYAINLIDIDTYTHNSCVKLEIMVKIRRLKAALDNDPQPPDIRPMISSIQAGMNVLDDVAVNRLRRLLELENIILKYTYDVAQPCHHTISRHGLASAASFSKATKISMG